MGEMNRARYEGLVRTERELEIIKNAIIGSFRLGYKDQLKIDSDETICGVMTALYPTEMEGKRMFLITERKVLEKQKEEENGNPL